MVADVCVAFSVRCACVTSHKADNGRRRHAHKHIATSILIPIFDQKCIQSVNIIIFFVITVSIISAIIVINGIISIIVVIVTTYVVRYVT